MLLVAWTTVKRTTVSEETFRSCIALTTVYLPNTVTTVEKNAFDTGMRTIAVHYDGSPADWSTVAVTEEGNAYLLSADMDLNCCWLCVLCLIRFGGSAP